MKGFMKAVRALAGVAAAAGVVFMIVYFVRNSKPVIYDLRAYLDTSVSGYNGEAVMDVSVNKNNLAEDILPQLRKKDHNAYQELTEAISQGNSGSFIDTLFDMTVSETTGLSNGDEVTVTFSYDNDALADYGIAFTGDSEVFPVEHLKEIQPIDLFDDLTLTFSGISPYLTTDERIFYESGDAYVVCTVTPSDHLQAGDTVTVTIDPEESELPEGTKPAEDSTQVTVDDQTDSFVMNPEMLDKKDLERIRSQSEKAAADAAGSIELTGEINLYADDGSLNGAAVIDRETPNLLAVYYRTVPGGEPDDPEAEPETAGAEDSDAAEADSAADASEKTTTAAADDAEFAEAGEEADDAQVSEYGVILLTRLIRTAEGNLTFRIGQTDEDLPVCRTYPSQGALDEALAEYMHSLKGQLTIVN